MEKVNHMQSQKRGLKNKAFTLIELLAVIIIIGIIALIASPIVIGTIRKGEKSSFKRSIEGLIKAVDIDYSEDSFLAPREYFYEKRDLTLLTVDDIMRDEEVTIEGRIDGNGFIYVDGDGVIHIENICNKNYCANGPEDDIIITENPSGEVPKLDKADPMIKLNGNSIVYIEINGEYKEEGATARTKVGEKLDYTTEIRLNDEVVEGIDTSREATYKVIYTATNNDKTVSVERTVEVLEMTPVITMTEPNANYVKEQDVLISVSGVKPNTVSGFSYQIDDGEIVKVTGTTKVIKLDTTGEHTVTVKVTDDNGHTNEISKTYRIDTTGPQIVLNPETVELESNEALTYDLLTGVSVTDNIDGTIDNSKIIIGGDTLLSVPGTYKVNYTVSDRLGNTSTATRTFVVKDLTKPEIVITPNETSQFVKSQNITITATDNNRVESISYVIVKDGVRGEVTSINNGGSVTLNSTGNYQIEVSATDDSGNTETKISGTYKIDTTPPVLVFDNVTLAIDEVAGYNLMTGVSATDNSGLTPTITYTGGLSATVGTQTITYTATDEAGNVGTKTRTFTITAAEAPIISFSPIQTSGWVKSVNITISATVKLNENLSAFTYSINNGTAQNGTRNGNTGTASVTLNSTGTYTISASATGGYGNSKTEGSGTYYIDATAPTVGDIGGNPTTWVKNATLTATLSDSHSGVVAYAWTTTNTTPTSWTNVTGTSSYAFSTTVTANGTYYLWAKDGAGNISAAKSVTVSKIDTTTPSITSSYTSTAYSMTEKTSVAVSTLYSATFGGMGGSVTCKNGSTTVTNLNTLAVGTHTLTCTATGNNGKTASVSPKVTIKSAGTSGSDLANKDNLPNLADLKRYRGANPNNWVCFGSSSITSPSSCDANHKWRIIGIDTSGRMKIMTNYYYSTGTAWDTNNSNNWARPATLKTELNGSSFYRNNTYIDATHRGYIINATWYTGANKTTTYNLQSFIDGEKDSSTTGYVGLMSMVDFGYAGSGCTTSTVMTSTGNACMSNNWIGYSNYQWSITPSLGNTDSVWTVDSYRNGGIFGRNAENAIIGVRPVVYLDSNVKIKGGSGTSSNPYILTK